MNLPAIRIGQRDLSVFDDAIHKEWLVTNGLGGYSSSTILGINTRKYHGLLVAALNPPGDRTVCLAKLDEEVVLGNRILPTGANEYRDVIYPQGHTFLKEFSVSPFPRQIYEVENVEIEKTVFMPKEKNVTVVVYDLANKNNFEAKFRIYPLTSCRHIHSVVDRWRNPLEFSQKQNETTVEMAFNNPNAKLQVRTTNGAFTAKQNWLDRLYYREESNRGESSFDDCYQPGYFEVMVSPGRKEQFAVVAKAGTNYPESMENIDSNGTTMQQVRDLMKEALDERRTVLAKFYSLHKQVPECDWLKWIILSGDSFVVRKDCSENSIVAGYHWFEPWGRDTFISLPGLMLTTGRFEEAKRIFSDYVHHSLHGLIPNFIQDRFGTPSYNTVDATLWFVNAVLQYIKYTGDVSFVQRKLWETLKAIVADHKEGTDYGIHLDNDGLLRHNSQLTWMDATVDGRAVTPRAGKAVEIQALWYNALKTMQLLAERFEETHLIEEYTDMAEKTRSSFNVKFWNSESNCLFDVLLDSGADLSLRPNQVIAASMDFPVLDSSKVECVLDVVQRELLTPYGLRTLARGDPRYRGSYTGDRRSRDRAYHNGTVWPWLIGPFATAFLKAKGCLDNRTQTVLKNLLLPLVTGQTCQAGLGSISEVFDGEPPHLPRGCIAQAWSVAEPLRAYIEDVIQARPRYEKEFVHP